MNSSLQALFHHLATAATEEELRSTFMDYISECFAVQKWGIYLMNSHHDLLSCDVHGVSDSFIERYQKFGKLVDPVMQYVVEYHAPAHEELILDRGQWKQTELYERCCAEYDHEHIMTGAVVGNGRLIGTIHFARVTNTPAFNTQDLLRLGAVCNHFSACLATIRSRSNISTNSTLKLLTKRELQIANLVAKGLTNGEIGKQLWISENTVKKALKKIFLKLNVTNRTEMVMQLIDR